MKRLQTRYWHLPFLSVIALFICGCSQKSNTPKETSSSHHLCQYVNPFIGTGGHGHTFPGATLPFGMVQISPDTRLKGWDGCSAYHDSDSIIYGFSHTHLSGTGVSDYGDILFMPMTGPALLQNGHGISPDSGYASRFDKTSETASPGYYSVFLKDYGIKAELTATERVGFHRYTAPISQEIHLILDLEHRDPLRESHITIHNHRKISGYRRSSAWAKDQWIYFQAEFSRPFTHHEIQTQNINAQINEVKARFTFASAGDSALLVKVSISPTNKNGPPANMLAEIPGWNFDKIRQQADSIWNQQLHKIVVEGGTKTQQRIFYTALYHSMLAPNLFSDAKGNYRGMDGKSHALKASRQYTVFSLWDTFRATHPLFTIIEQQRTEAFIQTFLRQYQEGGQLPVWELAGNYTGCMIGYHAISVIADAYLKGLRNFDAERALEAMQHSAEQNHLGLEYYKKQGFIGAGDESESVSKTLEYAYDDWCIAMMAKEMGKYAVYKKYIQRAQFYINLYDPKTGFFRAKMNGSWQEPFDPREVNFNYTEANAWQYSLFVPQDISGLIHLMGGKAQFVQHLDSLFLIGSTTTGREQADITGLIGQYAHGNEPSHHMAYLYSYAGESPKTQQRVREILQNMYHDQPDGLSGNEDCGQMSAWYVLSAMGFYPVTPGSDQYVIGSPLFSRTTIHLENGEVFRIVAEDVSAENMYIQSAELNGEPLGRLFLRQQDLMSGGELRLKMGATAQAAWAGPKPELPASSIETGERIAAVPFFVAGSETFTDSLQVRLHSVDAQAQLYYSLDGSVPTRFHTKYAGPFWLHKTRRVRAIAVLADGRRSFPVEATYYQVEAGRNIRLASTYANQYAAGGDRALMDGLRGGPNFRTGRWQGFQEDLHAVLDLGKVKAVRRLSMGFLQDIGSWIWLPKEVEFAISQDGKSWQLAAHLLPEVPDDQDGGLTFDFVKEWPVAQQIRYVRVRATNYGQCPDWHLGAGGKTWVFADEILVE